MIFGNNKIEDVMDYRLIDKDKIQTIEDIKAVLDYMRLFNTPIPYHPILESYFKEKKTK